MTPVTVLWIYIVLLLVGGFMGFVKARSKVSLITSSISAALLALCALGIILSLNVALAIIGLLLVVFIMRLAKTKKFMPSGMMVVVSAVTLVLLFVLRK